ncbi:MAG: carboxypeptidase regulatory-like domain-containing protein [Gemmatimonadales bacterium]
MVTRNCMCLLRAALVVLGLGFLVSPAVQAQTSTGGIRGYVTVDSTGAAVSAAEIQARNVSSGVTRTTTSRDDGSYNLPGLVPSTYELTVRHIGMAASSRRVVVQIGATALQNFAMGERVVEVEEITVTAAPVPETRTSEVATNITSAQIEALPSASRNFLDLAALAPGVTATEDRVNGGNRTFQGGGSSPNQSNVFVDGSSLKNDLTGGGVAGQDASRGNPFPRNAIQEYRVITQNFKAEYQKASSAIIVATTKSGGNVWSGSAFTEYQNKGLVAADSFDVANNVKKPDYSRYLMGLSAGGPIIRDRLHVFGSFEGNYQNRNATVAFTPPATGLFPSLDTVNLSQYNGGFTSPFRETLLFGKLSYAVSPKSTAEFSLSNRHETDVKDFGNLNVSRQSATNYRQNVGIATLKYNYFSGPVLNEANVTYQRFRRFPSPNTPGLISRIYHYPGQDAIIGSNRSTQDFTQKRLGFRDDLTYSGFQAGGQHIFKIGANVDFVTYDVIKRNSENPLFEYAENVNCHPVCNDTLANQLHFDYRTPYQLIYGTGVPGLNNKNNQLGIYLQDDWSPTPQLTINLGMRWDYESNMINTHYKTPQNVVDTLTRYNDSLPNPLDLNRYISTGNNRKPITGAFQPRLGFSYALDKESKTTVFGGFGIYYDRSIFDFSVDEIQKLTHPTYVIQFAHPDSTNIPAGQVAWNDNYLTTDVSVLNALVASSGQPEAFLIDNKTKLPKTKQWSLGVRRVLGQFVGALTYQGQRGTDLFTYNWANIDLNPDGSCCRSFNIGAHGFNNFITSTNDGKTWYDALSFQLDRPYRSSSAKFGWGAGIVYTYAERSIAGSDNLNDLAGSFPGSFPTAGKIPKHADNGGNDERHRVVANWITDVPYLFGIQFSGLITLGSGARLDIGCAPRFCGPATYINGGFTPKKYNFIIPGAWAYRRVDVRVRKDFPSFGGTRLGVTVDVFNVMNYRNFGCYNTGFDSPTSPNPNQGKAGCLASDPRRIQLGAEYNF